MKKLLLLLLQLTLCCTICKGDPILRTTHFSVNESLSQYDVSDILQDEYGFIWIATYDGLNRYDGVRNTLFRYEPYSSSSICSNRITTLMCDSFNKRLWIGAENDGVNLYNYQTELFETPRFVSTAGIEQITDDVLDIVCEAENRFWISTKCNIYLVTLRQDNTIEILETHTNNYPYQALSMVQFDTSTMVVAFRTKIEIYKKGREGYSLTNSFSAPLRQAYKMHPMVGKKRVGVSGTGLYIPTIEGLYYLDMGATKQQLHHLNIKGSLASNASISAIAMNDRVIYAVCGGLHKIVETPQGQFIAEKIHTDADDNFANDIVRRLYIDQTKSLWCTTADNGVRKVDLTQKLFESLRVGDKGDSSSIISRIKLDEYNKLWVGTQDEGLYIYNHLGKMLYHKAFDAIISAIYSSNSGEIWIVANSKLYTTVNYSKKPGQIEIEEHPTINEKLEQNNFGAYSICEDRAGGVWIGGRTGVMKINGESVEILPHEPQMQVRVTIDQLEDRIWVCTNKNGLTYYDLDKSGKIVNQKLYKHSRDNVNTISSNTIWALSQISDGTIYVGTDAGLCIVDPMSDCVEHVAPNTLLYNSKVLAITEDKLGSLWVNTSQGVINYNPASNSQRLFSSRDGLLSNSLTEAALLSSNNRLYIGSNLGINIFNLGKIHENKTPPQVNISQLDLLGKVVRPNESVEGSKILKRSMLYTNEIKLRHYQNSFTLYFNTNSLNNPSRNSYKYRLIGEDEHWVTTPGNLPYASYNNLSAGSYRFELVGLNSDGVRSTKIRNIDIYIRTAPWFRWWAYLIYFGLVALVAHTLWRYYRKQQELKQELMIEHVRSQAENDATENKIRFYTNITHELRTPLTLIMGPLSTLSERDDLSKEVRTLHSIMYNNGERLMELVNQFLDLRKIDNQMMPLRVELCNIDSIGRALVERFSATTMQRGINFIYKCNSEERLGWVDSDKITCIISNLLSNAFKYTPNGGEIMLDVELSDNLDCRIIIEDNGCGISEQDLPHIFKRFYQSKDQRVKGTGIGLEMVKSLVELHKGEVKLFSRDGEGTCFEIELSMAQSTYSPEEFAQEDYNPAPLTNSRSLAAEYGSNAAPATQEPQEQEQSIVLVVEDNEQLRQYIRTLFCDKYTVIESGNGVEGLEAALKYSPDLIISDVMMPEMDGIEFCRRVKGDFRIDHIPVVLLTAKSAELEGLESGAVDYIMKPFVPKSLQMKVKNILKSRKANVMNSDNTVSIAENIKSVNSENERKFLDDIRRVVEENMYQSEFGIDDLVKIVAISRSQLYRKMMALTGKPVSAFIRSVRLDKAKEMLETGRYSISEVLYTVGFSSPSYFTKVYKEYLGMLPSDTIPKGQ